MEEEDRLACRRKSFGDGFDCWDYRMGQELCSFVWGVEARVRRGYLYLLDAGCYAWLYSTLRSVFWGGRDEDKAVTLADFGASSQGQGRDP